MSQFLDFLRAVRADPDSDDPRLIFADWLEEQGDPRGELMRAQVERVRRAAVEASLLRETSRELELYARHASAWLGPLGSQLRSWFFWRGLLHVEIEAATLVQFAASTPAPVWDWIDGVRVVEVGGMLDDVLALPLMKQLNLLDLSGNELGDDGAVAVAQAHGLADLRHLSLENCGIGAIGTIASTTLEVRPRLIELDLSQNAPGIDGIRLLSELRSSPALRVLGLRGCRIDDEQAGILAASPAVARLGVLDLTDNLITDRGASAIAAIAWSQGLVQMNLSLNRVSDVVRDDIHRRLGDRVVL